MAEESASRRPSPREVLIHGAHLAALWAIAFAQPLLDLLGSNPEFFVARGNTTTDILILAFGFTLLPPLGLVVLLAIAAAVGRRPFKGLYLSLVTVLVGFFAVQLLERLLGFDRLPAVVTALVALALGAGFAFALTRGRFLRAVLDVLTVAPIVVLALFIFASGTSKLVLPQSEAHALAGGISEDVPIVMVIFDELPTATLLNQKGEIDAERFPGFARLGREATWYPNATTVADFTGRAVPAILTGLNPDGSKLPIAADQPRSIFTLLGNSYEMNVRESVTRLCPESLCERQDDEDGPALRTRLAALYHDLKYVEGRLVLPARLADTLPQVSTTFGGFGEVGGVPEDKRAGQFVRDMFKPPDPAELAAFVDEIPARGRTLSLVHMELPHEPFRYLPDGRSYNETEISTMVTGGAQRWSTGSGGIATVQQRHYLQTGYADTLIKTLIARLKREGVWERAMVVVTADHGISFDPSEPRRVAVHGNLGGVINPPLFIKYPGQVRGEISRRHVRTIDILPTIAAEIGAQGIYETDGVPIPRGDKGGEPAIGPEIEVLNGKGETVTATIDEVVADRRRIVAQAAKTLGDGGLESLGPAPWLLGKEVSTAPVSSSTGPRAELQSPGFFRDVDLEAAPLPVFIAGRLSEVEPGSLIAIALNGRVAATTRAFKYGGALRFGAVVPVASLRPGANQVTVALADRDGELTPLAQAP